MNYRHAYHAGNFADVLKHVVLLRALSYLQRKAAPIRVIDTHAGVGRYDLFGDNADKNQEWKNGVEKVINATFDSKVAELLVPYLESIRHLNPDGKLRYYPGSPWFIAHNLRRSDKLIANELHPEDQAHLKREFERNRNVKVLSLDGWTVLKSVLPPAERRGLTMIDPPFEKPDEFERLHNSIIEHQKRFATGTLILWYPIKDQRRVAQFYEHVRQLNLKSCLRCTLQIDDPERATGLAATGLIIVNPPFVLHEELTIMLPALCSILSQSCAAKYEIDWLAIT